MIILTYLTLGLITGFLFTGKTIIENIMAYQKPEFRNSDQRRFIEGQVVLAFILTLVWPFVLLLMTLVKVEEIRLKLKTEKWEPHDQPYPDSLLEKKTVKKERQEDAGLTFPSSQLLDLMNEEPTRYWRVMGNKNSIDQRWRDRKHNIYVCLLNLESLGLIERYQETFTEERRVQISAERKKFEPESNYRPEHACWYKLTTQGHKRKQDVIEETPLLKLLKRITPPTPTFHPV